MQHFPNPLPQGTQALRSRLIRFREPTTAKRWPSASPLLFQFLFLLGLWVAVTSAFAQTTSPPACVPYTANYPCAYAGNISSTQYVSVINESNNTILGTIDVVLPKGEAITPDNKFAYVGESILVGSGYRPGVAVIDTATGTKTDIFLEQLNFYPTQIAITPDGAFVWAVESTQIERIRISDNTVVGNITLPTVSATALAFTPDGTSAYVVGRCNDGTQTCVQRIVGTTLQGNPIVIPNSLAVDASVIVTLDGKFVCISTSVFSGGNLPEEFAVAFLPVGASAINTSDIVRTGINGNPSSYGLAITPNGTLYAAAPSAFDGDTTLNTIFLFGTIARTYNGTITVGNGPTGVAVSASGDALYVTNTFDGTVSVINPQFGTLVTTVAVGGTPLAIAAMPSIPPAITTQPADQQIPYGGTATLSVAATGTATLTYQWYQGTSGDTTNPVQGATASSFTTPALTTPGLTAASYNYWVRVANSVAHQDSGTATVTVSPPVPPTITTQPSGAIIGVGSNATLSVQASGTMPLSYQWFQGQSADTSTPIQGATGTSFMTPPLNATTSYWVQVSNVAGSVNSNTATVTVSPVPICMLELRAAGGTAQAVVAMATCTDQTSPPQPLVTTLDWGDGTSPVTVGGGTLQASHTYSTTGPFNLMVTGTNSLEITGFARSVLDLRPQNIQPPLVVFTGQPTTPFTAFVSDVELGEGQSITVNFECTEVLDSNGTPQKASDLGISCYAVSQPITLSFATSTEVMIVIQTSGAAIAKLSPPGHQDVAYASLSGLFFISGGISLLFIRRRALRYLITPTGLLLILVVLSSCGGGFMAPQVTKTVTPAGNYQVSVVDVPASNTTIPFAQTTLIVPLEVKPFQ